jgi:hypothetical protein
MLQFGKHLPGTCAHRPIAPCPQAASQPRGPSLQGGNADIVPMPRRVSTATSG